MEKDFVSITDENGGGFLIIDHKEHKYAQSRDTFGDVFRKFDSMMSGMKVIKTEIAVPDKWKGLDVERSRFVMAMAVDSPMPMEMELRISTWATSKLPGLEDIHEKMKFSSQRNEQEMSALIATMALKNIDYFRDMQNLRKKNASYMLPVRTVTDVVAKSVDSQLRIAPGDSMMHVELEMSNFRLEPVDEQIFSLAGDYQPIDLLEMTKVMMTRTGRSAPSVQ